MARNEKKRNGGEDLVIVNVTEMSDGEPVKGSGQPGEGKVQAHQLRMIGFRDAIPRQGESARADDGCGLKEAPAIPVK